MANKIRSKITKQTIELLKQEGYYVAKGRRMIKGEKKVMHTTIFSYNDFCSLSRLFSARKEINRKYKISFMFLEKLLFLQEFEYFQEKDIKGYEFHTPISLNVMKGNGYVEIVLDKKINRKKGFENELTGTVYKLSYKSIHIIKEFYFLLFKDKNLPETSALNQKLNRLDLKKLTEYAINK